MLARRLLQRLARPVTIRIEAEQNQLEAELTDLRAAHVELSSEVGAAREGLRGLRDDLDRADAHRALVEDVLDAVLTADLPPGVRRLRRPGGACPRAICSLATGDYRSLLARSAVSFERYAARWGWDLVLSTEEISQGRPSSWGKLPLIRSLMDDYEWVLWLDADVVIVDLEADISREIENGKNLYVVEHSYMGYLRGRPERQHTANAGVMLLRSCEWSRSLLDEMWARDRYIGHRWWENAALLELLGYSFDSGKLTSPTASARLVTPTAWLRRTKLINPRWNGIELDRLDRPGFVHRGFYDIETRKRQVTADLACALGWADPLTAGRDRPARPIRGPADVHRREELPLLLNSLGLEGTGVELGVRKGHFSEHILEYWSGTRLISVDPWSAAPADEYVDISNVSQDEHDVNHLETNRRLERFGTRSEVWRQTGAGASAHLPSESLDFVYLDARHDFESVREDIAARWPLVRPGGMLAGHDYVDGLLPTGVYGVKRAVDGFFAGLGLPVHSTTDDAPYLSWIVVKPSQ